MFRPRASPAATGRGIDWLRIDMSLGQYSTASKRRSFRCLPFQQKGLGEFALAADLEGTKVLIPRAHPVPQVPIPSRLSACTGPRSISAVPPVGRRGAGEEQGEDRSIGSWASVTEGHAREFFFNALPLVWIGCLPESIGKTKEALFFGLPALKPRFDQLHQNSVGARIPSSRNGAHVSRDAGWQGYALTNDLL